jgi:MOSC domain-containing protein YiiM
VSTYNDLGIDRGGALSRRRSNLRTNAKSLLQPARHWRPNPLGLAAVEAARGDPTALLALEDYELHERQHEHSDAQARRRQVAPESADSRPVVGRLLSVNVGMPKDVPWQGKTVVTAVFKDPVAGPRRVGKFNIDGDGQGDLAGHGGEQRAVFVYQIDSYRYWERELGRNDFVYGQFGENFTVEGLADDEVCIGDRYQIGTAMFEVTQPRVTCYRVGIRMNDPRIPALLVSHHRPGFYFRVLEEGDVQAGDKVIKLACGSERMLVAEVDARSTSPGTRAKNCFERSGFPPSAPAGRPRSELCSRENPGAATPASR